MKFNFVREFGFNAFDLLEDSEIRTKSLTPVEFYYWYQYLLTPAGNYLTPYPAGFLLPFFIPVELISEIGR